MGRPGTSPARPQTSSRQLSDESLRSNPPFRNPTTPREYADCIQAYASRSSAQSLYPGTHLESLASFLLRPYQKRPNEPVLPHAWVAEPEHHPFVIHYDLKNDLAGQGRTFASPAELLEHEVQGLREANSAHLLFLRGYPTAQWLGAIGSKFTIDPDFFGRHLDFRAATTTSIDGLRLPSLSSANPVMACLRINTLASRMDNKPVPKHRAQADLDQLRRETNTLFGGYLETLRHRGNTETCIGESVVREFAVLNGTYTIIEQDVSIYVEQFDSGFLATALAWLDSSRDLSTAAKGPWNSGSLVSSRWSVEYLPILQPKAFAAFQNQHPPSKTTPGSEVRIPQSAAHIPLDYARHLDTDIHLDSLSILGNVFHFAASSELLVMKAIEMTLNQELDPQSILSQETPTISNLLYNKQILERHITRLRENVRSLRELHSLRRSPPLPSSGFPSRRPNGSERAFDVLIEAFQSLLDKARALSDKCDRGMDIVSTQTSIRENSKAIAQAESMTKLTRLALPFIPLSLTTSFFGMNFRELGTSPSAPSIWIWFVTAALVLFVTFAFLLWSQINLMQHLKRMRQGWKRRVERNRKVEDLEGDKAVGVS